MHLSLGEHDLQGGQVGVVELPVKLLEHEIGGVKELWDELRVIRAPAHTEVVRRDLDLDARHAGRRPADPIVDRLDRRTVRRRIERVVDERPHGGTGPDKGPHLQPERHADERGQRHAVWGDALGDGDRGGGQSSPQPACGGESRPEQPDPRREI